MREIFRNYASRFASAPNVLEFGRVELALPRGSGLLRHRSGALQRVVFAQGVPVPVIRHQDSRQVRMARKDDSEQVVNFPLRGGGRRPQGRDGGHLGFRVVLRADAKRIRRSAAVSSRW